MSVASFLKKHMLEKEMCLSLGNEAETVTYNQYWTANREFFQGTIKSIEEDILELSIPEYGTIWLNCKEIESFWKPGFKYHQAIKATVTTRPAGGIIKRK